MWSLHEDEKELSPLVFSNGKTQADIIKEVINAVEQGLGIANLAKKQQEKKYRTSDVLSNAAQELQKLTQRKYQKVSGSRAIGPHLKTDGSNRSHSFNVLLNGIEKLVSITL